MAKAAYNILRFFQRREEPAIPPFKQFNYLNLLSHDELADLLQFSEEAKFVDLLPELSGKNVLQIGGVNGDSIARRVFQSSSRSILFYRQGSVSTATPPSSHFPKNPEKPIHSVAGKLTPLAVSNESCDVVIAPLASRYRLDVTEVLPEFSRALNNGGRLVVSTIHPTLELFLYNQNPSQSVRATNNLELILGALRKNSLYLEEIREGAIDREAKPFFVKEGEEKFYEELKGIPLVLFLRAVKFVRNPAQFPRGL